MLQKKKKATKGIKSKSPQSPSTSLSTGSTRGICGTARGIHRTGKTPVHVHQPCLCLELSCTSSPALDSFKDPCSGQITRGKAEDAQLTSGHSLSLHPTLRAEQFGSSGLRSDFVQAEEVTVPQGWLPLLTVTHFLQTVPQLSPCCSTRFPAQSFCRAQSRDTWEHSMVGMAGRCPCTRQTNRAREKHWCEFLIA